MYTIRSSDYARIQLSRRLFNLLYCTRLADTQTNREAGKPVNQRIGRRDR